MDTVGLHTPTVRLMMMMLSDDVKICPIWCVLYRSNGSVASRCQVKSQHIHSYQSSVDVMPWIASRNTWLAALSAAWSYWKSSAGWRTVRIRHDHRFVLFYPDTVLPALFESYVYHVATDRLVNLPTKMAA